MIQAAPHAMSASQGKDYYDKEYSSGDYYMKEANEVRGEWSGKGAEKLGLKGAVEKADFTAVLEGKTGADGKQIIPDPPTGEHRAAWDFTCSPDKSVSVMALVGGDHGIVEDVKAANAKAMHELERFSMAKDKDRAFETSGNLTVASFVHETSRKLDPQLHIHNVVMNMTQRSDGKQVALETRELYAAQSYTTAVFRAELAERLQARGYQLEIGKDGNVAIKDVPRELCDEFSKRRREDIEPYLQKRGLSGPDAAQKAAHSTRRVKQHNVDAGALKEAWKEVVQEQGVDLGAIRAQAEQRAQEFFGPERTTEKREQAKASLHHAMDHLSERKATFQGRELYTEALKHGMGKVKLEDIRAEAKAEKGLIRVQERNVPSGRMTTTQALKLEQHNVHVMREGRGSGESILKGKLFEPAKNLTDGQKKVAEHILTSPDQVLAVEGKAGAGKTYTLEAVVSTAKAEGWEVRGFTPTTSAAKTLGEAGLETKTIAALGQEKGGGEQGKQLWIVDEAGLMSSKGAGTVLDKAKEAGAKVVFVGDRMQHSAVEAGKPFAYLQGAGLQAVRMDEIQRQARPAEAIHVAAGAAQEGRWEEASRILEGRWGKPMPELEKAAQAIQEGRHGEALEILEARSAQARALEVSVKDASEGRTQEAVSGLDKAGKIIEITDKAERHRAVARDYLSTPKGQTCIVIAPSNAERHDLNTKIREELIKAGTVGKDSFKGEVRVSKRLTEAERKDARNYELGDHVKFGTGSKVYGIEKGLEGRVMAVDREKHEVRVELTNGKTADFDPSRYYGGQMGDVSKIETRRLAEGDRIQYREATKLEGAKVQGDGFKIANGDVGTIRSLDRETGKARVELEGSKRTVELDLTKTQPIDHAYAMTSHVSQGRTEDRSLVVIDTTHSRELVNREQFYVSESRAALECKVYTDRKADLAQAVSRETGKSSALEMTQGKAIPTQTQEVRHAVGLEPRREHERGREAAELGIGRRTPERGERVERTPGEASKSQPSRGTEWSFDGGPAVLARADLSPRGTASERDGSANRAAQQSADRHSEISGTSGAGGSREAEAKRDVGKEVRGLQTELGRAIEGEAGTRGIAPEAQRGLDRGEGRGHEASGERGQDLSAGTSRTDGRDGGGDRDREQVRDTDRGLSGGRGAGVNQDRGGPDRGASGERGQAPGKDETLEGGSVRGLGPTHRGHGGKDFADEVSGWDKLRQDTQALKDRLEGRDAPAQVEAKADVGQKSPSASRDEGREEKGREEVPARSKEAQARAQAIEGQLKATEKALEGPKDWREREGLKARVKDLKGQLYEAKQDARTDINQPKIQELKKETQALERQKSQRQSFKELEPIYDRQEKIKGEIYELRHGPKSELGNHSSEHQLGWEEYKLHQAHRAINDFGKRHPETGIKSPVTRESLKGMNQAKMQELSKNLQQAAGHLQAAVNTMDRLKDGNIGAELKVQLQSAAKMALAKAAPPLAAVLKAVEIAKNVGLHLSR